MSGRISIKQRRIFFSLVVVLYLAAHITRAQEVSIPPEPTTLPTEIAIATFNPTDEPTTEDVDITLTPSEPTALPTDEPVATADTTDEPTLAPIAANIRSCLAWRVCLKTVY
ncbi:MAG: hypothetical protein H0X30_02860 [Anaerolineae bacterium]|nr:hypothetical protein [Anaerolineae bacterium]